jgi:hypothetical protein
MGFEEIHIGLYWKPVIYFYKINKLKKFKNRFPIKSIAYIKFSCPIIHGGIILKWAAFFRFTVRAT